MNPTNEEPENNDAAYTLRLSPNLKGQFQRACKRRGRDMAETLRKWIKVAIARANAGQDVEPPTDWGDPICNPTFAPLEPGDEKKAVDLLAELQVIIDKARA